MEIEQDNVIADQLQSCTGCGLCQNTCPKSAISMQMSGNGFFYPHIDLEKCVDCGLCHKLCPTLLPPLTEERADVNIVALKAKNQQIRQKASSGGAFIMLSNAVLEDGGVVYGCAFDHQWLPVHSRAEIPASRDEMCGSKYVQSQVGTIYQCVEKDLKEGRLVLFSGTPCQVDAVHKFLQSRRVSEDNLITVDLICHGVPSPKTWEEHVSQIRKKYGSPIHTVTFRKKDRIGNSQALFITFENGKEYFSRSGHDLFYKYFLKNYHLRPSCYSCRYTSFARTSDVTLGDFGGSEKNPQFKSDNMGVSQVHINTQKGQVWFDRIAAQADCLEITVEEGMQGNLQNPTVKPNDYDKFERVIADKGLDAAAWSVSDVKGKIQWILNKLNVIEFLYRVKHNG